MPLSVWERPEDFESFIREKGTGWIFKHSTRCPISSEADLAFTGFSRSHPQVPVFKVLVIENRPTSSSIADKLGIPHASPQAILIREGAPVSTLTHWDITAEALVGALKGSPKPSPP